MCPFIIPTHPSTIQPAGGALGGTAAGGWAADRNFIRNATDFLCRFRAWLKDASYFFGSGSFLRAGLKTRR
jgi:hypothetical protein